MRSGVGIKISKPQVKKEAEAKGSPTISNNISTHREIVNSIHQNIIEEDEEEHEN